MMLNTDQYNTPRTAIPSGEKNLILTVLKCAVDDAVRSVRKKSRQRDQQIRLEARLWISFVDNSICGFDWYCEIVGINPEHLRCKLKKQWGSHEGQ